MGIVQKCGTGIIHAIPHRRMWRSINIISVDDMPLRADECSAYFGYLSQQYERLPHQMVFIHADAPEHVGDHEFNILGETLRALVNGQVIPFASLGLNRITMPWRQDEMDILWRGLFHSSVTPIPS